VSVVYVGKAVAKLRQRKGWQQFKLLEEFEKFGYYDPVIHRLEVGEMLPQSDTLPGVLDVLGLPVEEFLCPYLEDCPMELYIMRDLLIQALDNRDLETAELLLGKISLLDSMKNPTDLQFFLSQKAKMLELKGEPTDEIMDLVIEGLKQTFDDFNEDSPDNKILVFEEPELFHTLAKLYAHNGDLHRAIRVLKDICVGLQLLPTGERERDRRLTPVMLSLADFLLQNGEYEEALRACEAGIRFSAMRSLGQGTPELLRIKAKTLLALGKGHECEHLLIQAYVLYLLSGENKEAETLLAEAKEVWGVSVAIHGIEKLDIPQREIIPYARGKLVECDNLGGMIRAFRIETGLTQKELCQGICSVSALSKLENNETKRGDMHIIEPILQRLGRDPLLYCNFLLNRKDFEAKELRDKIHLLLIHQKYDQAKKDLEKLKTYKAYQLRVNLQFIKRAEIALLVHEQKITSTEIENMLLDALRLTCPNFNEDDIRRYPLTHDESIIISSLAAHFMETSDPRRASKIYEALIDNLNRRYVDEYEKARMYSTVMFDYSTCLGRMDRRLEALEVIKKAEAFDRNRGRLPTLASLSFNKAYNMLMRGHNEESLSHFVLAYYGFAVYKDYGKTTHMKITRDFIKKTFDVELD